MKTLISALSALLLGSACATKTINLDSPDHYAKIEQTINADHLVYRKCYDDQKKKDPLLDGGKVITSFVIGDQGVVTKATLKDSTLKNSKVEQCIVQTIKNTKFSPDTASAANIVFPFVFSDR